MDSGELHPPSLVCQGTRMLDLDKPDRQQKDKYILSLDLIFIKT